MIDSFSFPTNNAHSEASDQVFFSNEAIVVLRQAGQRQQTG